MSGIEAQIDALLAKIDKAHAIALRDEAKAKKLFDQLESVIDAVHESWSGSWAGYHANLYFREFERPDLSSRFSVEWGGLHGIKDGWADRADSEVVAYVETKSGVAVADLEALAAPAYGAALPLYQDAQALVTPILEASGDSSRALLEELRNETWGVSQAVYINAARPGQIMSRDSGAIQQGMKTPPHIALRARAVSEYSRVSASATALERAALALKQARTALTVGALANGTSETAPVVAAAGAGGHRAVKWVVAALILAVAIETFVLVRPAVVAWFDATFTQEFLTSPTRLGFSWSDVSANALAALVLLPFAWIGKKAVSWLAAS